MRHAEVEHFAFLRNLIIAFLVRPPADPRRRTKLLRHAVAELDDDVRVDHGLLAERLGLPPSTWSSYYTGARPVPDEVLAALACLVKPTSTPPKPR